MYREEVEIVKTPFKKAVGWKSRDMKFVISINDFTEVLNLLIKKCGISRDTLRVYFFDSHLFIISVDIPGTPTLQIPGCTGDIFIVSTEGKGILHRGSAEDMVDKYSIYLKRAENKIVYSNIHDIKELIKSKRGIEERKIKVQEFLEGLMSHTNLIVFKEVSLNQTISIIESLWEFKNPEEWGLVKEEIKHITNNIEEQLINKS